MNICIVCSEYPPGAHGGIGTFTQVLGRGLVKVGHHVRVVGIYPSMHNGLPYEDDEGVTVWRLREPAHAGGWLRARWTLYHTVSKWCQGGEIDLVEVPDWEGWAAAWPRLRVPVIARMNGSATYFADELGQPVSRSTFLIERASLRRADFWCSASRYTADKSAQLFSLQTGPSAILHNPVEVPGPTGVAVRSKNKVVFSGTLTAKKGIVSLVNAWPRVVERCHDAELNIFGKDGRDGNGQSMEAHLRSLVTGAENIRFHGHVTRNRLFEALAEARVGVFPSYAEAYGIAPFEAMRCGCPTIYSRRGPGPELLANERDALLVDPDSTDEISSAIIRLLEDDRLAERLGRSGQQCVAERFSSRTLVPQNENFYSRCIAEFTNGVSLVASNLRKETSVEIS